MKCRYNAMCKGYKPDGYTCNRDEEARTYCGSFRNFRKNEGVITV